MPAFTLPGLSSGQNTNEIVNKLVELEAKPIQRWERDNKYNESKINAWSELRKKTITFQEATRNLVSFTAPFGKKNIHSIPEGFLSGEATKSAQEGQREIEVVQLATNHQIATEKISDKIQIPGGSFQIKSGNEKIDIFFSGGSIQNLSNTISEEAKSILSSSLVKVDSKNVILTLRAKATGKFGKLKFEDPDGILNSIGLVGKASLIRPAEENSMQINSSSVTSFKSEKYENAESGYSVNDSGLLTVEPNSAILLATSDINIFKETKNIISFEKLPANNTIEIAYSILNSNNETIQTEFKTYQNIANTLSLGFDSKYSKHKLKGIILGNKSGETITIQKFSVNTPQKMGKAKPNKSIVKAVDNIIKVDGIEVKRSQNENITDVLEGISLNLLKKTDGPVALQVVEDTKDGLEIIKNFVKAHNDLISFSNAISASNKKAKLSDLKATETEDISASYWESKMETGILSGENTILRLVSGIKTIINESYLIDSKDSIQMLYDIGISTGSIGSKWQDIQEGLLVIDEKVLNERLSTNPDSVRDLFAYDSNFDNFKESGLGIKMIDHLRSYVQQTGGVITTKIKLLEDDIADNKKNISNFEAHLSSYESNLKTKFMYMEQGVGKNKSVGNYLKNNFNGNQRSD